MLKERQIPRGDIADANASACMLRHLNVGMALRGASVQSSDGFVIAVIGIAVSMAASAATPGCTIDGATGATSLAGPTVDGRFLRTTCCCSQWCPQLIDS